MLLLATSLLAACGGGGGGSSSTVQPAGVITAASFPLQSADKARTAAGSVENYTASGDCAGTVRTTNGVPAAGTFEGAPALVVTVTSEYLYTNCTQSRDVSTEYYDANYAPLGSLDGTGGFSRFATSPVLPVTVKVGDSGALGSTTDYTDSTKAVVAGRSDYTYVVEAGTSADTAIVNITQKSYDTANQLLGTMQTRYRLTTAGAMDPVSVDIQVENGTATPFRLRLTAA